MKPRGVMLDTDGKYLIIEVPFDPQVAREKWEKWQCYFCAKPAEVWTRPKVVPVCEEHLEEERKMREWIKRHNKRVPMSREEMEWVRTELEEP